MPAERTSPDQSILINGQEMQQEMKADLLEIIVSQHIEGGDAFQLRLNALNSANRRLKWVDEQELSPGNQIEIQFGYTGNLTSVILGEITAVEARFPDSGGAQLLIQGFDRLHRLRRGRRTRVFHDIKDSQIAEQIAGDLGLDAQVEDTRVIHRYLLQNNLSDLDFLLERARRIHFEAMLRDRTLIFRSAANDRAEVVVLEYMVDLTSFSVRLSTAGQASRIVVRGWNPGTKETLIGSAATGDETTRMEGEAIGAEIAGEAFSEADLGVVDIPVDSQEEADQMAKAKFNDMCLALLRGEARSVGNPNLRAGDTVRINGVGNRFTGLYYVTRAEHRWGPAEGYLTKLGVARSGT